MRYGTGSYSTTIIIYIISRSKPQAATEELLPPAVADQTNNPLKRDRFYWRNGTRDSNVSQKNRGKYRHQKSYLRYSWLYVHI
jgi:hypothetical protein